MGKIVAFIVLSFIITHENVFIFLQLSVPTLTGNLIDCQRIYIYKDLLYIVRFAASSTTAGDTSGPTDALSSTETAGTATPATIGDMTATLESTAGGK